MKAPRRIFLQILPLLLIASNPPVRADEEKTNSTPSIDGTWRWSFTMPDGTASRPKLTLATQDGRLTGTSSFRSGTESPITNATVNGEEIRFQVIRPRDGQDIVTTYAGKWSGKTIKGKIESNWAGENQTFDWEAHRVHLGADGTWRWTNSFGGRRFETRVELDQEGEVLTGSTLGRFGRRSDVKNGTVKDGEIYFEIERTFGDTKIVSKYRGKQTGDTIKGKLITTTDGEDRESDWHARRVD